MQKHQNGFTLVELSIVLVIIGLIAGGLIGGNQLMEKSRAKAVLAEMNDYVQAFAEFQDKYHYRPGDLLQAGRYFTGGAAVDGDGNTRIDTVAERNIMWPQLFQAGMIRDNLEIPATAATTRIIGTHRPSSGANGGWTWVDSYAVTVGVSTYTFYDVLRHGTLDTAGANGGEYLSNPQLSISNHRYIDTKIDTDNTPLSGKVTVGEANCAQASGLYATNTDLQCTVNIVEDRSVS